GVSFTVEAGKTLALVGESGCGKSTVSRLVLRLIEPTSGEIVFDGQSVTGLGGGDLRAMRRNMQLVFQDPFASLNPRMTVGAILGEPFIIHNLVTSASEREDRVASLLVKVGLKAEHMQRYPHEFSGGQRQRVAIGRAIVRSPDVFLFDEPLSNLDAKLRIEMRTEIKALHRRLAKTIVYVTHDQV
ncbi:ABC transporter ATP-binding protein, partial [Neisseria gonorrhoeae]